MPPEARLPLSAPTGGEPRGARAALRLQAQLRHLAASLPVRLAVFGFLAVTSKWATLGTAGLMNDARDGEYFCLYEEVARLSVARYHQLPFWDPYYCGGLPALGTPSARFASPTLLLSILFGTLRAESLIGVLMTIVGLEGMYRYTRARRGGPLASMLVAPVFAMSGFFATFPTYGWTNFYGFELVPWALFGIRLALGGSRRGVVLLGLSVAWMVGFGGTYAAPITALAAGFELVEALARRRGRPGGMLHPIAMGGLCIVFAAAAGLVRLWPIAEMLSSAPRILGATDGHPLSALWTLLFGAGRDMREADFLVGWALLPVFAVGALRRRSMPMLAVAVLCLWLAMGYDARPPLFAWLRRVPPYTMLRAPERILSLFTIVFAVVAALGMRRLEGLARKTPWLLVPWAACVALTVLDVARLVQNDSARARERTLVDTPLVVERSFHQARGNRSLALFYPFMSRGSLGCFDDYNIAQSPDLLGDLRHEEYLRDAGAGTLERLEWTPNRIRLRADLSRPARVYVNQNWHPGWHTSAGTVVSERGLLAVDLPAGKRDFDVSFAPRSGLGGGATSLAALAVAAVAVRRSRRRPASGGSGDAIAPGLPLLRELLWFASPFAFAILSFVAVREPRRPPPPPVTPAGEPMVVDAPPEGAKPVGAAWGEGVTLVAARIVTAPTRVDTEKTATVELDWRFTKKPPKGLGVFLHLESPAGTFISVDYAFLSGVMLLDDVPLGRVVRDVGEPIALPWNGSPQTYEVHVGLFRARQTGERLVDVTGPGASAGDGGRVLVGSFVAP